MVRADVPTDSNENFRAQTRAIFNRYNIVNEADLKMASEKLVALVQSEGTRSQHGHDLGTVS
jgi:hypothetical protein